MIEPMATERDKPDYVRLFHLGKEVLKGVNGQVLHSQPGVLALQGLRV